MSDKNDRYGLPPTSNPTYISPYQYKLPFGQEFSQQGSSSKNESSSDVPTQQPTANLHFPPSAHLPFSAQKYADNGNYHSQLNHNENCNRNRALSLPTGYGLPLCTTIPRFHVPLHLLPTVQGNNSAVYTKSRRKSSADVTFDTALPVGTYQPNTEYPYYPPLSVYRNDPVTGLPMIPHSPNHLLPQSASYPRFLPQLRHEYNRHRSTNFDHSSLPPTYLPTAPSSEDTDDVFVCDSNAAPSAPPTRQFAANFRRKRTHTVDIPSSEPRRPLEPNAKAKKVQESTPSVASQSLTQKPCSSMTKQREQPARAIPPHPLPPAQPPPTTTANKLNLKNVKKVAWKDPDTELDGKEKEADNISCNSDLNIFVSTLKSDRLVERNYDVIKADPDAFTVKNKIGHFFIGPQLEASPVKSIQQYLVRNENTYDFYTAKLLIMDSSNDEQSGRMLLQSEFSMLSLVQDNPGVVHHHGLYKDMAYDPKTGSFNPRLCLILDCVTQHDYDDKSRDFLNLQQHVIREKQLSERETILLFRSIVGVVDSLHQMNIVHRDLKLGNMILNRRTNQVLLTNFCLGRHLKHSNDLLRDKRGSPAYISPDVLSGKPYNGKSSDMWSLGVLLFTMLYGHFPFYDQEAKKLFQKIQKGEYSIPSSGRISSGINDIIRGLLVLDSKQRLTSSETLAALQSCHSSLNIAHFSNLHNVQVVPEVSLDKSSDEDDDEEEYLQRLNAERTEQFRKRLASNDAESSFCENIVRLDPPRPTSSVPVLRHISNDARPLTVHELYIHRQIVNNANNVSNMQG